MGYPTKTVAALIVLNVVLLGVAALALHKQPADLARPNAAPVSMEASPEWAKWADDVDRSIASLIAADKSTAKDTASIASSVDELRGNLAKIIAANPQPIQPSKPKADQSALLADIDRLEKERERLMQELPRDEQNFKEGFARLSGTVADISKTDWYRNFVAGLQAKRERIKEIETEVHSLRKRIAQ